MKPETSLETSPATLDHAGIAARIPHHGRMCLLDRLEDWSEAHVHCSAVNHRDADHPLRGATGLLAPCAIEYAGQAMALHGALMAELSAPPGAAPRPGYIASVRDVRLHVPRLDHTSGALHVHVERLAGDASVVSYRFSVDDAAGAVLVEGRATIVLNAPAVSAAATR